MKKSLLTLMASLMMVLIITSGGAAQVTVSGDVDWDITFEGILILNYYDEHHLKFSGYEEGISEGMAADWELGWTATSETATGTSLSTSTLTGHTNSVISGGTKTVLLPGVWALRGLTPSGTATVSIDFNPSGDTQKLTNDTSEVEALNLKIKTSAVALGKSITVPVNGLLPSKAVLGDVQMDLDISNLTKAGTHTGGSFTITATNI